MQDVLRLIFTAFCVTTVLGSAAVAETIEFKADLSGAAEVPPNASSGKGEVSAVYDTGSHVLPPLER